MDTLPGSPTVRGTVPCSGVRLNRELHVELGMTKGKKKFNETL
jgi:hypothetical protein